MYNLYTESLYIANPPNSWEKSNGGCPSLYNSVNAQPAEKISIIGCKSPVFNSCSDNNNVLLNSEDNVFTNRSGAI